LRSRSAGLVALWCFWLFTPMLRRIIELGGEAPAADPLAVMPIIATGLLAVMELQENRLNARARTILILAVGGILLGVPLGLTIDPAATTFAAMAYVAGVSAFVIGWGDEIRGERTTLERFLTIGLVPIALYGIAQYFLPFTPWDAQWVDRVSQAGLGSIISPQEEKIRVYGTLNSPFTFAIVLSIGIIFALAARRKFGARMLVLLPLVLALALTYVRSAWVSLVVGLIVYAACGSDRSATRTVVGVFVCLAAVVVLGGSNPTTAAFSERITSLGDLNSDTSAQDRLGVSARLVPESVANPFGTGLGQAGLAANLSESKEEGVVDIDNGYLAILYQCGPLAFLLVICAFVYSVRAAIGALERASPDERPYRAAVVAILLMMLVAEASGDVMFGLPGVIFWYLAGSSVAACRTEKAALPINSREPLASGAPA